MSKLNISDEKYILVQFPNENNEVGIGFQDWLQYKKDEMNDFIQSLINNESETTMLWPRCDVGPANITKKRTKDCEWDKVVVKILASGCHMIQACHASSHLRHNSRHRHRTRLVEEKRTRLSQRSDRSK